MEEQITTSNQSGDHKYFTVIPNYILNHSTATAQALYLQLKRLAGDTGETFCSRQYLVDKLCISKHTLLKELNYLKRKKWIEELEDKIVETIGGKQRVKSYRIVDIWKTNLDFYAKGEKNRTPLPPQGGAKETRKGVQQGGAKETHKEEPLEEEPIKKKATGVAVNRVLDSFLSVNPTRDKFFANKTLRAATERLLKKYSEEWLVNLITNILPKTNAMPFAPRITTPLQLEDKLGDLQAFLKQQQTLKNKNKVEFVA